jgi:peptide/nickel transport system substrate-binding protein
VGAIVHESMKQAGIKWTVEPREADNLSRQLLLKADFQVIEYAFGNTVDPGPTTFSWLSDQIPTAANKYEGDNYLSYRNPALDPIMRQTDSELDSERRHHLVDQVYTQIQRDLPALPLYSLSNITAWRADEIAGPIGTWNQSPYGTFWNMDFWFRARR